MREDEDQFRQYMPVLRRLIILVAVITAIPVAMWTITAVVRTYVGPPKLPTFRPMAAAPAPVGPNEAAAAPVAGEASKGERQPAAEANATASGAGGSTTMHNATLGSNASAAAPGDSNAAPATTAGMLKTASLPATDGPSSAAPGPENGGVAQFAPEDQQPPAASWPSPAAPNSPSPLAEQQPMAAAAPDAKPLSGNVPLPRKRPAIFAIAQAHGIPLPRPRPDAAGPAVAGQAQQPTPADWLRNLFGQQGQQPAAAAPEPDGYQAEPH
jgi:hypothetical protein